MEFSSPEVTQAATSVAPSMRQRSIAFTQPATDTTHTAPEVLLHLSVRCFTDNLLLFVSEDGTCAPGVVLRYDASAAGPGAFLYDGETPSLEVTVLLGLRDHPLTNMLASSIAHRIRRYGEERPLLMGLSVVKTARLLMTASARKAFLEEVSKEVMALAGADLPTRVPMDMEEERRST